MPFPHPTPDPREPVSSLHLQTTPTVPSPPYQLNFYHLTGAKTCGGIQLGHVLRQLLKDKLMCGLLSQGRGCPNVVTCKAWNGGSAQLTVRVPQLLLSCSSVLESILIKSLTMSTHPTAGQKL